MRSYKATEPMLGRSSSAPFQHQEGSAPPGRNINKGTHVSMLCAGGTATSAVQVCMPRTDIVSMHRICVPQGPHRALRHFLLVLHARPLQPGSCWPRPIWSVLAGSAHMALHVRQDIGPLIPNYQARACLEWHAGRQRAHGSPGAPGCRTWTRAMCCRSGAASRARAPPRCAAGPSPPRSCQ